VNGPLAVPRIQARPSHLAPGDNAFDSLKCQFAAGPIH